MKKQEKIVAVEYIVQDCPILGKVVEKHYIEQSVEHNTRPVSKQRR